MEVGGENVPAHKPVVCGISRKNKVFSGFTCIPYPPYYNNREPGWVKRVDMVYSRPCNVSRFLVVSLMLALARGRSLSHNTQKKLGQEVRVSLLFLSLYISLYIHLHIYASLLFLSLYIFCRCIHLHIYAPASGRRRLKSAVLWPTSQASARSNWPGHNSIALLHCPHHEPWRTPIGCNNCVN